jgi:hypothetical protein
LWFFSLIIPASRLEIRFTGNAPSKIPVSAPILRKPGLPWQNHSAAASSLFYTANSDEKIKSEHSSLQSLPIFDEVKQAARQNGQLRP